MARLARLLSLLLDVVIGGALVLALAVALSGGWSTAVGGVTIRQHSTGGLWALALVAFAARFRLPTKWWEAPSLALFRSVESGEGKPIAWARRTRRLLIAVAFLTLAVKVANIFSHDGFFSGDDVEVHEMTLSRIVRADWPIWNLRSSFFPFVVLYPFQWIAAASGMSSVVLLVAVGRLVIAVTSTLFLLSMPRFLRGHDTWVVFWAPLFLGTSAMFVVFGGMELPRILGGALVFIAFLLLQGDVKSPVLSGLLIAVAACLRFSEAVVILPAVGQMAVERRKSELLTLLAAFGFTATAIQVASDYLFWGAPLASLRSALQFTLIDRLSSRGYQPFWFYLTSVPDWADWLVVSAAGVGIATSWRLGLWIGLPFAVLSALPHKEPRYLLPLLPLVCLAAAAGSHRAVVILASKPRALRRWCETALVLSIVFRGVGEAAKWHIHRTDREVQLARTLSARYAIRSVAIEEPWRFGGHLYWPADANVIDASDGDVVRAARQMSQVHGTSLLIVSSSRCDDACVDQMRAIGFVREEAIAWPYAGFRASDGK